MEAITGIKGKTVFKDSKKEFIFASEQLMFWLLETILFFIFQRLLPIIIFSVQWKQMFQENSSFRLVETDFGANKGFRKKKEKL